MTNTYKPQQIIGALQGSGGLQIKDCAIIYTDLAGNLKYAASPLIKSRITDVFSHEFCQSFREIVDEEHEKYETCFISSGKSDCAGTTALAGAGGGMRDHIVLWLTLAEQYHTSAVREQRANSDVLPSQNNRPPRANGRRKRVVPKANASSLKRRMTVPDVTPYKQSPSCSVTEGEGDDDDSSDTDVFEGAGTMQKEIRVNDDDDIKKYYFTRFVQMQQIPCKIITKAWVKVVQPKKQARHPYNGGKKAKSAPVQVNPGELTKPDWWPPEGCRHREPDHIQKCGMFVAADLLTDPPSSNRTDRTPDAIVAHPSQSL